MTQIFLVDDNPLLRQSLRALLELEPDLNVCGEAATAEAALEHALSAQPDLVIVDVSLPDFSGIELVRALRERAPGLLLAMLSGHRESYHVDQALKAGADGYILKGRAAELRLAIRRVLQGERYLSAELHAAN